MQYTPCNMQHATCNIHATLMRHAQGVTCDTCAHIEDKLAGARRQDVADAERRKILQHGTKKSDFFSGSSPSVPGRGVAVGIEKAVLKLGPSRRDLSDGAMSVRMSSTYRRQARRGAASGPPQSESRFCHGHARAVQGRYFGRRRRHA